MFDANRTDRRERRGPSAARGRPGGFTLIELIVVMVVIGILVSLVLIASANAVQTAREKATQSLIAKIDAALSDRIDAILQSQTGEPTDAQKFIAPSYGPEYYAAYMAAFTLGMPLPATPDRAYVLAQVELFLREVPDVFYVQAESTGYPLNFAANPYPIDGAPTAAQYVLPLGTGWPRIDPSDPSSAYFNPGQGIYGASYGVAAGLYKNLGYLPAGYDGVDNNGDGIIDDWTEGVGSNTDVAAKVRANLANHQHKTARAEVLYALLVEAQGPFGSIFNREDFTDQEVMDTDGDGLPEFVDAWGEPLQFYRWPVFYHSELQRGLRFVSDAAGNTTLAAPYGGMIDQREQDPLDPGQHLMAPAWWSLNYSDPYGNNMSPPFPTGFAPPSGATWSAGVTFFENYFYRLREPLDPASAGVGTLWDRGAPAGAFASRRAYSTKCLIVSSGPDKELGLFQFDNTGLVDALTNLADPSGVAKPYSTAFPLIGLESTAAPLSGADLLSLVRGEATVGQAIGAASADLQAKGQDDISNHNIPAGGIGGSTP